MGDGLCKCGCGQKTKISQYVDKRWGYEKGQPRDYINGHANKLPYAFALEDRGYSSPCWIWNRHTNKKTGYALLSSWYKNPLGGSRYAHRYFYTLIKGPIPEGLQLDHLCRVRCCVNPNHLEPVTAKENCHRASKISTQQREEILELRRNGLLMKDIAAKYGVRIGCIEVICRKGKVWTTVRLTKTQVEEMLGLRRNGTPLKDIAARYGIHHKCAGTICRRGGVYTHKRPSRVNDVLSHHL
jgi:uncharacterized protein (DUF433 family)